MGTTCMSYARVCKCARFFRKVDPSPALVVLPPPRRSLVFFDFRFSTSAPLGALVLLVASDVCLFVSLSVCPYLLMSNSGATSKCNYDGFR